MRISFDIENPDGSLTPLTYHDRLVQYNEFVNYKSQIVVRLDVIDVWSYTDNDTERSAWNMDIVKQLMLSVNDKYHTPNWNSIKSIAFSPKVKVPRYKLSKIKTEKGIVVQRNGSTADVVITSDEAVKNSLLDTIVSTGLVTTVSDLIDTIRYTSSFDIKGMLHVYSTLSNTDPNDIVICDQFAPRFLHYHSIIKTNPEIRLQDKSCNFDNNKYKSGWYCSTGSDTYSYINSWDTTNYVHENALNAILGESVIDKEAYDSITQMIKSSNRDDCAVALSIVGNCNFVASYKYALAWFIMNTNEIMMVNQNVAFKAFRNFIGYEKLRKHGTNYYHHIDQILQAIIDNGLYEDGFLEELMQIDDLPIVFEKSKLIKPVKFDLTDLAKQQVPQIVNPVV